MKIYVEKPNINGRKININYKGKFTLKFQMNINIEIPNVNKKCLVQKIRYYTQKVHKNLMSKNSVKTAQRL